MKVQIRKIRLLTTICLIALVTMTAFSQASAKKPGMSERIPNLEEDQKIEMQNLRVAHKAKVAELKAEERVLKAELDQLSLVVKADMNKIYAKVDEVSAVQGDIVKARIRHQQEVRGLLTLEQRVAYDELIFAKKGKGKGKGQKKEDGRGEHSRRNEVGSCTKKVS